MLILGMETSLPEGFVFLAEDGKIINYHKIPPRSSSGYLVPAVKWMLEEKNISINEIKAVVVTTGPGSFTGVRIGVSFAKSLSFCLNIGLIGIPTLDCISFSANCSGIICSLIEGYGGCYFAAFFEKEKKLRKIGNYLFLPVKQIMSMAKKFSPQRVTFIFSNRTSFPVINQNDEFYLYKDAIDLDRGMLKIALKRIKNNSLDNPLTLKPVYVSPPRIKRSTRWKIQ